LKESWEGSSEIVARCCIRISGYFTIHAPVTPPPGVQFCPVIRWTDDSGALRRLKLFAGVGEVLPYPTYIGEAIKAPAAIEFWNTRNYNPGVLGDDWLFDIGLLENPDSPTDRAGTIYTVSTCIASFYSGPTSLDDLFSECPTCT
jgi:hypothetical protein